MSGIEPALGEIAAPPPLPEIISLSTRVTSLVTNDSSWGFTLANVPGSMFWLPLPPTLTEGDWVKVTIQKVQADVLPSNPPQL